MPDRTVTARLVADIGRYKGPLVDATNVTRDLAKEVNRTGALAKQKATEQAEAARQQEQAHQRQLAAAERLGRGMLIAGAGIAAGIGLATKAAIDWETAWAGVIKTVDGTEQQLAGLEDELREMARELPQSHAEIAAVAEAAGQLGVATEDVAGFTRVMLDLGTATNLSANEAAVALAQLMNIMGTSSGDVDNLGAAIVDLGNNSATTEADIVAMAQRIAGAGATIGLSEADVLGFSAALASVGIRAEAGGSAISRAMIEIEGEVRSGGDQLETLAEVAGMSASEFQQAYERDAARAIATFIAGLGRMQASGEDVFAVLEDLGFSEIRLRDALLRLASSGDLVNRSLDTAADAWEENLALAEEAERRYGTTAAQLQIARNRINDFAIDMGQVFLPAIGSAVSTIGSFIEILGEVPGPVKTVIGVLAAAGAAIGLLGGAALLAVPKIVAFKASLDTLATSGGAVGAMARGLRGTLAAIPWGPLGIALTAATIGITAYATAQANARAKVKELSQTLDEQTGAVTHNTRVWVANELANRKATGLLTVNSRQNRDFVDNLERANVSMETAVDAVLGNAAALAELNTQLEEAKRREEELSGGLKLAGTASREAFDAAKNRRRAIEEIIEVIEDESDSVDKATKIQQLLAEGAGEAADETGGLASGLDKVGGAAGNAASEVESLNEAFDELFGIQMDIDRATIAYHQGLQDLIDTLDEGERSLAETTQAGRDNRSAVLDQVDAIGDLRQANIDNGMAIDEANELYQEQLDAIEDALIERGFEEESVRDLIDAYRNMPASAITDVRAEGVETAIERVRRLREEVARLTGKTIRIGVTGGGIGAGSGVFERHGGIVAAQQGLITRSPTVLFGERGTGMEAFIPRDGISADRGLTLADTAARWHGGRVVAGDGAVLGGPFQWHGARPITLAAAEAGDTAATGRGSRFGSTVVEHQEVNVRAFSDRFSLRQVMDDLAFHGVT